MTGSPVDPGIRRLRLVTFMVLAFALAAFTVAAPSVVRAAEGDEAPGPAAVVVHSVDASSNQVVATVLADDYDVGAGSVSIEENGEDKSISGVRTASRDGRLIQVAFVVDTSRALAQGEIFEAAKTSIANEIRRLPSGVEVAVLVAGDTAVIKTPFTADHDAAAASVESLELSNGTRMFNAIDRAAALFADDTGSVATVVAFSGSQDEASTIGAPEARRALATSGAQLVAVRYGGGESTLGAVVSGAGGLDLAAGNGEDLAARVGDATKVASDRLLITYDGVTEQTTRADATISIGSATGRYSYPGGLATTTISSLQPPPVSEASGPAFFRSTMGLYLAIGLAFVGLSLAVYAGMSLVSGETSLQGLIDRYSGETAGAELNDEEQAIVQTALVRRAVELSESFAEDRGFLTKVEEMLEQANLPLRPGEAMSFFSAGVIFFGAGSYIFTQSIIVTVILTVLFMVALIGFVRFKAARRVRAFEKQLPDTLTLLAGTLRAGYSLPQGLEAVSNEIADPMGYELRRVMTEARLGREIEESLASTAERLASPDFAWAVMAIGIQREVGGNLNELLMTVADTMVARERLKGEVAALTAEGKLSAIILGGLPPGLGFVMWIMNPDYIETLFTETLGHILLGVGVVSAAIGMAWMKKVITINV